MVTRSNNTAAKIVEALTSSGVPETAINLNALPDIVQFYNYSSPVVPNYQEYPLDCEFARLVVMELPCKSL